MGDGLIMERWLEEWVGIFDRGARGMERECKWGAGFEEMNVVECYSSCLIWSMIDVRY